MKTILPYFLLAVMAVLLFLLWQSNREVVKWERRQNELAQGTIKILIVKAERAGRRADSLSIAFVNRRTSDSVALRAVKIDNSTKSKKVADLRPTVQPLIDSIAELKTFVTAYDSLLAGKNEEIKQLEERHIGQILDLQALIKEKTSQIMAQLAISEVKDQAYTNLETDLKKTKRRSTFKSIGLGILTGGIIYMSLKE